MRPHLLTLLTGLVLFLTSTRCQIQNIGYTERDTVKKPSVIFYRTHPAVLVLIDGTPRLQRNAQWDVDAVLNSPFVIVKDKDEKFYLYGGGHWYVAPTPTGPYAFTQDMVSRRLRKIARGFEKAARKDDLGVEKHDWRTAPVYDIVVSTVPAVLVQSDGAPQPVQASQLPADLAKIPAQSPEAGVPADVPGTAAAAEVPKEQAVPDVQKIDRNVTTRVVYDGTPTFSPIGGTRLQYATNTCAIVLLQDGLYYTLDDGVWFVAGTPLGAWHVSNRRPLDVELIPQGHPVYRARFVYVYRTTADYIWDGYLPGYLDDPSGGCGLAEMEDYDVADQVWCFDLDFVFGWGGGWYDGYYGLDRHHRYYSSNGMGGKWAHWHKGRWRPRGSWASGGSHPPGALRPNVRGTRNLPDERAAIVRRAGNVEARPSIGAGSRIARSTSGGAASHSGGGGGGSHVSGGGASHSGGGGSGGGGHAGGSSGGGGGGGHSGGGSSGGGGGGHH
jgi:hypothetical protein